MILINGIEVGFEKFPNGETKVPDLYNTDLSVATRISFKYSDDSDLIKLMLLKDYLDDLNIDVSSRVELVVYYMPYSRMDRSENGSPFTLKYVCDFINLLRFRDVKVIEPHSDVTVALLNRSKPWYVNFQLLPVVMKEVKFDKESDYIVFPDAGASKRYGTRMNYNTLIGNKNRDFLTGEILSLDIAGHINNIGTKAIIVDDLSSYGTTFVNTAKELRSMGIKEVYLLVAHAENSIFKGKLFDFIDKIFTTDSILTEHTHWGNRKMASRLHVFEVEELVKMKEEI